MKTPDTLTPKSLLIVFFAVFVVAPTVGALMGVVLYRLMN
jgi:glycerol uptake facilitator-like aquaporin